MHLQFPIRACLISILKECRTALAVDQDLHAGHYRNASSLRR